MGSGYTRVSRAAHEPPRGRKLRNLGTRSAICDHATGFGMLALSLSDEKAHPLE